MIITRFNNNIRKPQSKRSWDQHRFVCHAVDDWNALPDGIRNISDFLVFRRRIRNMKSLLSMLPFFLFLDSYIYIFFFILTLDLCRASLKTTLCDVGSLLKDLIYYYYYYYYYYYDGELHSVAIKSRAVVFIPWLFLFNFIRRRRFDSSILHTSFYFQNAIAQRTNTLK